jgi:hypothetical protein
VVGARVELLEARVAALQDVLVRAGEPSAAVEAAGAAVEAAGAAIEVAGAEVRP